MSRSYKKTPIQKDNVGGRKHAKRTANKKVRQYKGEIADGKAYRKLYCSWDIYDWISYSSYEDYREQYEDEQWREMRNWKSEKDCFRDWARIFRNK